jgi:phage-related protein
MLNWLDSFFNNVSGSIGALVSKAVHWAIHALASVVFAVFKLVGKAWNTFVSAVKSFHNALDRWAAGVIDWVTWLVKVEIPAILRWAEAELAKLSATLAQLYDRVTAAIADLIGRIESAVKSVTDWVIAEIWDPLKKYADAIYNDLLKWGFYAYTVLTHLDSLADAMIMYIVASLEKYAWQIAGNLGTFMLALIYKNLARLITLAEDIITAVF